ncbi:cytochrome c-type biogenesis protein [Marinobacter sp. C2H3]|uniref:cytochrome c-type biogenesis protein n=1 Tax=Marinobacter sp. C2H3 TaxID=3119003 RepID=UPI00300F79B6
MTAGLAQPTGRGNGRLALLLCLALTALASPVAAASADAQAQAGTADLYPFPSAAEQARFQALLSELRCPMCENQTIADSGAPIAADMRDRVYRMMQDGASDDAIVTALAQRFGDYVRYRPVFDASTALLWLTPILAVLIGAVAIALMVRQRRRAGAVPDVLTEQQRARADRLLTAASARRRSGGDGA